VGPRAGLNDVEKRKFLTLPGLELPPLRRPARSQSLYRLCYKFECYISYVRFHSAECLGGAALGPCENSGQPEENYYEVNSTGLFTKLRISIFILKRLLVRV
jgi:hypothetical protein